MASDLNMDLNHPPSPRFRTPVKKGPESLILGIINRSQYDTRSVLEMLDNYDRTALHYAAMFSNSLSVIKLLIDKDEDCLLMETKTGSTPLDLAKERIEWGEGVQKEGILIALGHVPPPPPRPVEVVEKKEEKEEKKGGDGRRNSRRPSLKNDTFISRENEGKDTENLTGGKKKKKKFFGLF